MTLDQLKATKAEALRFLKTVNELEQHGAISIRNYLDGSKLTGSVKRASMDLTSSLADLRRPN